MRLNDGVQYFENAESCFEKKKKKQTNSAEKIRLAKERKEKKIEKGKDLGGNQKSRINVIDFIWKNAPVKTISNSRWRGGGGAAAGETRSCEEPNIFFVSFLGFFFFFSI